MLNLVVELNEKGQYIGFELKGHADSAPYGQDLICAASTALAAACIGSIEELIEINFTYCLTEGEISCHLQEENAEEKAFEQAALLINSFYIGMKQVANSAQVKNKKYLKIITKTR